MASKKLTSSQVKELKDCFDMFDSDKSGSISLSELEKVCAKLGFKLNDKDIKNLMNLMDRDGSGTVDFNEFSKVMADQFFREPTIQDLESAFDYFDSDKSGFITEDELFTIMNKFRGSTTKDDIKRLVKSIDKDSDGRINKSEFIKLFAKK